jgi:hypothetical protein
VPYPHSRRKDTAFSGPVRKFDSGYRDFPKVLAGHGALLNIFAA